MKSKLNRIFYIYSEASLAVVFAIGGLLELACAVILGHLEPSNFFTIFAGTGAVAFFTITALCVRHIYRQECKQ